MPRLGRTGPAAYRPGASRIRSGTDVSFVSESVKRLDDGRLEVSGRLALHGVEAPLRLPVKVTVEGGVLRGEGMAHIGQSAFGIKPYSAGMGTTRNADGIELRISLVGRAPLT